MVEERPIPTPSHTDGPPNSIPSDPPDSQFKRIPIDKIRPTTYQARKDFDEIGLRGLADSLNHEGLIQPVVVRRFPEAEGDFYELLIGERRWRAAKMLGWRMIEAKVIRTVSEGEAAAKGLIENMQRKDLNPIEEAEAFAELNRVDPEYWTQEKIGEVVGKDRTYVTRSLALLDLPDPIKEEVRRHTYSRGHAIELLRLPNAETQLKVAKQIAGRLTREQTRKLVDKLIGKDKVDTKSSPVGSDLSRSANVARGIPPDDTADPLGDVWPTLAANAQLNSTWDWKAEYKGGFRWSFEVGPHDFGSFKVNGGGLSEALRSNLAAWFICAAQSLSATTKQKP